MYSKNVTFFLEEFIRSLDSDNTQLHYLYLFNFVNECYHTSKDLRPSVSEFAALMNNTEYKYKRDIIYLYPLLLMFCAFKEKSAYGLETFII